ISRISSAKKSAVGFDARSTDSENSPARPRERVAATNGMGRSREWGSGNGEGLCPSPCEGRGRLGGGCVGSGATVRRYRASPRNPSPTLPCLRRGGSEKRCARRSRRTLPLGRIECDRPVRLAAQELQHQRVVRCL